MPADNTLTQDLLKHSVTAGDATDYRSTGSVISFQFSIWGYPPYMGILPNTPPPYWSYARDAIFRSTIMGSSRWSEAVAIAATKAAATTVNAKGDVPLQVRRAQQFMVEWGKDGYVVSQEKGVSDFCCTDNGEFHEIVRVSNAAGSRVLGLAHLDSLRVTRTGDPEIPYLFRDLKGKLHELRYWQVIDLVDQPDPGFSWNGIGHCAASRAYDQIYKLAGVELYFVEKITGSGATEIEFIQGVTPDQIEQMKNSSDQQQAQKGLVYFKGKVIVPIMSDIPISGHTVNLKGVPDGFDRKQELDIALLSYANALGLVLTDLQPLSGQGLGTGAQTVVLEEKAQGRGQAARRKDLTHQLNVKFVPPSVTTFFTEVDLRDDKSRADNAQVRANTRKTQIDAGEITAQEARQMAADAEDIPEEFLDADITPAVSIGDEDQPQDNTNTGSEIVDNSDENPEQAAESNPITAKELDVGYALYRAIKQKVLARDSLNA